MDVRNRRRLQLLLIVAIFAASFIAAAVMMISGWAPAAHSYGQPIQPERDLVHVPIKLSDGKPLVFPAPVGVWTLVALPGTSCAEQCLQKLDLVHRAQIALGKDSDKLRLVYLGAPPTGAAADGFGKVWTLATTTATVLDDLRPATQDSVSAVLVTPSGHALLHYPATFEPSKLRPDLQKVVKVTL